MSERMDVDWDAEPLSTRAPRAQVSEEEGEDDDSSWLPWLMLAGVGGLVYFVLRKPKEKARQP